MTISGRQQHGLGVVTTILLILALAAGLVAEIFVEGDLGNRIAKTAVRTMPIFAGLGLFVSIAIDRRRKAAANIIKAID